MKKFLQDGFEMRALVLLTVFLSGASGEAAPKQGPSQVTPRWSYSRLDAQGSRLLPVELIRSESASLQFPTAGGEFRTAAQHSRQAACLKSQADALERYLTPEKRQTLAQKGIIPARIRIGLIDWSEDAIAKERVILRKKLEEAVLPKKFDAAMSEYDYPAMHFYSLGAEHPEYREFAKKFAAHASQATKGLREQEYLSELHNARRFLESPSADRWIESQLRERWAGGAAGESALAEIREKVLRMDYRETSSKQIDGQAHVFLPPLGYGEGAVFLAPSLDLEMGADAARSRRELSLLSMAIDFLDANGNDLPGVQDLRKELMDIQQKKNSEQQFYLKRKRYEPFTEARPPQRRPEAGMGIFFPDTYAFVDWFDDQFDECQGVCDSSIYPNEVESRTRATIGPSFEKLSRNVAKAVANVPSQELVLRAEIGEDGSCVQIDSARMDQFFAGIQRDYLKRREKFLRDPAGVVNEIATANRKAKEYENQQKFSPQGAQGGGAIHP